jgi:hypothetical protein
MSTLRERGDLAPGLQLPGDDITMASPELHTSFSQVVCLTDAVDEHVDEASNRRVHERLKPRDLQWLRSARLKYGPEVKVIDLSAGGMLLETESELAPDANIVVELTGAASPILVPSRVLRCRVATLGEILKYQGACAFKRPLTLPELAARSRRVKEAAPARSLAQTAPAAASWQKVIARFKDGRLLCGFTNDFHPSKLQLHISPNPRQGDSVFVPLSQLKALFFVREFLGDPTFVERKAFVEPPQGRKVEVTFHDDEIMVGSTLGYRADGNGFFLHPADSRSNNIRVFVTAAGMQQIRFL